MKLNEKQQKDLLTAATPLMQWINDNCHPHCEVTVTQNLIELTEGAAGHHTDEFVKDQPPMNSTTNYEQLKLDLAKAFPEIIDVKYAPKVWDKVMMGTECPWRDRFHWNDSKEQITSREWLQVCWECEETLNNTDTGRYEAFLSLAVFADDEDRYWIDGRKHIRAYCIHATWQQRATALVKVKGGGV